VPPLTDRDATALRARNAVETVFGAMGLILLARNETSEDFGCFAMLLGRSLTQPFRDALSVWEILTERQS
jgi:hypothetical protein